jgi:putative ABC transport system permease protein
LQSLNARQACDDLPREKPEAIHQPTTQKPVALKSPIAWRAQISRCTMRDILQEAYAAMNHNRRRTLLTMLGMGWGIATVVMLLSYGNGFGRACEAIFANWGTRLMIVIPGRTSMQAGGQKAGVPLRFTVEDVDLLKQNVPEITQIEPQVGKTCHVHYESRAYDFWIGGGYPNTYDIRALKTDRGRFYNMEDQVQRAHVAVIGWEAKEKLFSGRNALHERIHIDGIAFEVIGVLAPKMQANDDAGDRNINRAIYIPITAMSDLKDTHYLDSIWFNYEASDYLKLEQSVRYVMAMQHKFNAADHQALVVFNVMQQVHQFELITLGLKVLLGFIGTLTLGIGGVGLMNIMLVSVTQRTREIGMEKSLGARSRDIFLQFLAESLTITFLGGVLGVMIAMAVSLCAGRLTLYSAMAKHAEAGDIRLIIDPWTLIVATAILAIVGLGSGMLPAIRASRLDPIEALRWE